jgi:putative acetyltransferase
MSIMDPHHPEVQAVIIRHLELMARLTPDPAHRHAMDPSGLAAPDVIMFGLRDATGALVAIGAVKQLSDDHAELKSMHTLAERRGSGLGSRLLELLITECRRRGCRRISLETGTQDAFAPARRLYERAGFTACAPFADYRPSGSSTFYTLELPD